MIIFSVGQDGRSSITLNEFLGEISVSCKIFEKIFPGTGLALKELGKRKVLLRT